MSGLGWKGEHVRLVPLDKARHLENSVTWLNDPEVTRWMLRGDFPMTRLAEEEWFDQASKASTESAFFAVETLDGEHVGVSGFHAIDWRNRVGTSGTIIGAREKWGRGLGTDSVRTRSRYAFEVLGLRLLLSEVMDGNVGSLRALTKAGYVESGCIPGRWWKRGAWRDSIQMHLEADEWRKQLATPPTDQTDQATPAQ